MASLLSGSVGGAIGVGAAYPFDTLSTKAQVSSGKDGKPPSMGSTIVKIFKEEGVPGFFEGVLVTMIGQALIKAIQFATNELTFLWLGKHSNIKSNVLKMAIAGVLSGLISSFVVSPVELVKIRMQAQNKLTAKKKNDDLDEGAVYKNELDCAQCIVKNEGWSSLFTHGLWITIIREIPSFAIYFVVYGVLARSSMATTLGEHAAPLIFGALAGWAMWIPTYPIDIVKTIEQVQTRKKGDSRKQLKSCSHITSKIYKTGGVRAFFDGLEPKLARAAIKHAVTFWVYEVMMNFLRPSVA
ncbi:predicted protein [Thalassiosira pseudonana CCMP1335]|uniref:Mitochondrial carrier protein n=1 Tax=Thalassiosira pseudonana TaxID=35128 RepID=B8BVA6_THAPS|nr:predicted protein [Thalassiosira pseudonana CCMP1335]EED95428.1 predicted protein [Thalassiosira pseudonana CCMP1335]